MIFVDTNVIMYALGRPHSKREPAKAFFRKALDDEISLCTSTEVLQELLHVYVRRSEPKLFDEANRFLRGVGIETLTLMDRDVMRARALLAFYPDLEARDLCHLAVSERVGATGLMTYDGDLAGASISLLTRG